MVMEPTRNAWVPLAAWFRRHGAPVIMVPPEQSADLRGVLLQAPQVRPAGFPIVARLPLLHPEGLRPAEGLGPADALRRAANSGPAWPSAARDRRPAGQLPGTARPGWHAAFGGDLTLNTPLRFLAAGTPTRTPRRLGKTTADPVHLAVLPRRLGSRARHGSSAAAAETLQLWDGESAILTWPRTSPPRPAWPWRCALRSATWTPSSPACCTSSTRPAS